MTGDQLALWAQEPCHQADPHLPGKASNSQILRQHWIEPEAGRAAGGYRRWVPGGPT